MAHAAQRIAGIDYGSRRIGIALADSSIRIATAYDTYQTRNTELDGKYFADLVQKESIDRLVVGLPLHLDGRESTKSKEARRFGEWLGAVTQIPVEFFDERFTTVEADEILRQANVSGPKRDQLRDQIAAQLILTAYLESGSRRPAEPGAIDD